MTDTTSTSSFTVTDRTRLARRPDRGSHERALVHAIIDEALYCHVGFQVDGSPCVLPTAHARIGDALYLHGARKNRMLHALCSGQEVAVTFTLLDGLVFARTAFHHSVNYRSATLIARGVEVLELAEKAQALAALVEHLAAGRSREVRMPNEVELRTTMVVRLPIEEASAKLRKGPPIDAPDELGMPYWAGELPLVLGARAVRRAPELAPETAIPPAVAALAARLGAPHATPIEWLRPPFIVSTDRSRLDLELVCRFLSEEAYWAKGLPRARIERAIEHSVCFGLYEGTSQIGFARVTSDYARFAYLADVFVLERRRGQGLGTLLVSCALEHPELRDVTRFLLGTRDAHAFYERLGFRKDAHARFMERLGEPSSAPLEAHVAERDAQRL